MTPCTCNTEMGDTCTACAPPAIVPPKLGDRWGDLSPEQRAMVTVGTVLSYPNMIDLVLTGTVWLDVEHGVEYQPGGGWELTRLGPAPTATPADAREGWPVLVRAEAPYLWRYPNGDNAMAKWGMRFRAWWMRKDCEQGHAGDYNTEKQAAEALRARLPDEASTPAPVDPRDAELTSLRAALEAQTLANGVLRGRVAEVEGELSTLRDHANRDPQDDRILDHALALLDLAAEKNETLQHIAAILRVGVGRP